MVPLIFLCGGMVVKKWMLGILLLMTLLLGGCSMALDAEEVLALAKEQLDSGSVLELEVTVPEAEAVLTLSWSREEQSCSYDSPAVLEGLCFSRRAGSVDVGFAGIREKVQEGQLLRSSAVTNLWAALDALMAAEPESCSPQEEGLFRVDCGGREVWLDGEGEVVRVVWEEGEALRLRR